MAQQLHFNQTTYNICKYTAFISFAVIFLLGITFLRPFSFTDDSYADTETTYNGDYYIETTAADLNLTINTTPAGNQAVASHDVTVKTDDPAGYTLTVSVNNDTSNALDLNGNTSATEKFSATSGTYDAPKALDDNSWGFADTLTKKNNNTWAAVPLLSQAQQIKQTSSANTSGDTTTMYYAINAKYDGQHSNGNYSNTIVYSVTGNTVIETPLPTVYSFSSATYLQEVTAATCNSASTYASGTTYSLKDKRTEESYMVRKLADGRCWMVENLYLPGGTRITSGYSDISDSSYAYTLPASVGNGETEVSIDGNLIFSADRPTDMNDGSKSTGSYYSWPVATAGKGSPYGESTNQNPTDSICPKNWGLPNSSEFSTLYNQDNYLTSFRRNAGYYDNGYIKGLSSPSSHFWWSRTGQDASYAYSMFTWGAGGSGRTFPSNADPKYKGYPVLCIL